MTPTTTCNQGISIDTGFMVQRSLDGECSARSVGLNSETCYCLITDHHSGMLYGQCFASKRPPVAFLNQWLAQHGCTKDTPNKYVHLDQGGELPGCHAIISLFESAGYNIQVTATDTSSSNGLGECPHQTISNAILCMLTGASLPTKFWPYAFHHFLRLYNVTRHADATCSPMEICTGCRPNLSLLRTFGCRIYALPAQPHHCRPENLHTDARRGFFLGYAQTFKNALYYDEVSEAIKICQHVVFDEAMTNLPYDAHPSNTKMLQDLNDGASLEALDFGAPDTSIDLDVRIHPFTKFKSITMTLDIGATHPLHFESTDCSDMGRAFITKLHRCSVGTRSLKSFRASTVGSYIIEINGRPVFRSADVHAEITRLCATDVPPTSVDILIAPERHSREPDRMPLIHLRVADLQRVHALQSIPSDGVTTAQYQAMLEAFGANPHDDGVDQYLPQIPHQGTLPDTNPHIVFTVSRLQNDGPTAEEHALMKFTRKNLMRLSNWAAWDEAFDRQLDAHHDAGTFGTPVLRPSSRHDSRRPNVFRIIWSNHIKVDGTRKARSCMDGSKRAAPDLRQFNQTYSSCIEQLCQRLFFALAAHTNKAITFADTTNAYQQSPPPSEQCYLEIDDAYCSWYRKRFNRDVDPRTHKVPLLRAFQGHPEAGVLWERHIVGYLTVDDFAITSDTTSVAETIISMINTHVTTESKGMGTVTSTGTHSQYNGVDIRQTCDYIQLSCDTYIHQVLQFHGWETPGAHESDRHDSVPLSPDSAIRLQELVGPPEHAAEHAALERQAGFNFRQVLGEIMYAYVICRVDIGFSATLLARFSSHPAIKHYHALKGVVKYLRRTQTWDIMYWRPAPREELPHVPYVPIADDPSLPRYPDVDPTQLTGFVDASHAIELATRRSITGLDFMFAGAVGAYKSNVQPTVSTSSTEAEFIASVFAARTAKYLRSVLTELGFPPTGPTLLHIDNQAAIAMVNEDRPTPRARHIDIQWFVIQEWRCSGIIRLIHIPSILNPADQHTKALATTLHHRHARRLMGHHGPRTRTLSDWTLVSRRQSQGGC